MSDRLPEFAELSGGLVLDGEVVAFIEAGVPHFADICARVLHGDDSIPVTYAVFDVLRVDGHDLTCNAWSDRRAVLDELDLSSPLCLVADVFDHGEALFRAVCHGLEGVVAKRRNGRYKPGYRGWVKVKNPAYWRRESELEGVRRSHEGRTRATTAAS
jgi:bifunctional non-homologous end joining protein LigD